MTKTLTAEPDNVETMASVDRFGPVESKTCVNRLPAYP